RSGVHVAGPDDPPVPGVVVLPPAPGLPPLLVVVPPLLLLLPPLLLLLPPLLLLLPPLLLLLPPLPWEPPLLEEPPLLLEEPPLLLEEPPLLVVEPPLLLELPPLPLPPPLPGGLVAAVGWQLGDRNANITIATPVIRVETPRNDIFMKTSLVGGPAKSRACYQKRTETPDIERSSQEPEILAPVACSWACGTRSGAACPTEGYRDWLAAVLPPVARWARWSPCLGAFLGPNRGLVELVQPR